MVDKYRRRHDSDSDSSLEVGGSRRDRIETAHHHRSKSKLDLEFRERSDTRRRNGRRREDTDSSDSDRELPRGYRDSRRRNDRRQGDGHLPVKSDEERDSRRRGDRKRRDTDSSESEKEVPKNTTKMNGDHRDRDRESIRRRHDRGSPKSDEDLEKFSKSKIDGDSKIRDSRDRDSSRKHERRRYGRDSPRPDEDLEKISKSKVDGYSKVRGSRDGGLSKKDEKRRSVRDSPNSDEDLERLSKGKVDGDSKVRDSRDRGLSKKDEKRRFGRDSPNSDENLEGFSRSQVDGDSKVRGTRDRDLSEKHEKRRSGRDSPKSDEDLEKFSKSKTRDSRDKNFSQKHEERRSGRDSLNSDEELEEVPKIKRDIQANKEIHEGRERDSGRRNHKRSHEDYRRKESSDDEERLKEGSSRGELVKNSDRGRAEDNGRGRGTDENYRDKKKEKKVERKREEIYDDRHQNHRGGEDGNEHRQPRREWDGHDRRYSRGEKDANENDEDITTSRNNVVANDTAAIAGKTGGVYIPPFKLAQMMKNVEDKSSIEYQRMTWDALRKSINGLVNKVNAANIKNIVTELFEENLIRGRGLFCRSCMKSQMASPGFTDVFSALVAVVNTKFPEVGELLLRRIVLQLKRAFKRNDKHQLLAAVKFIAHLVNQQVAHEIIALELLTVLLENPTDDSVEVAVGFVTECGALLQDLSPQGLHGIFERFRGILHEGEIDKRVQFLIEGLFAIRKAKFEGHPAVRPQLDLVDQEDQLTHELSLEDEMDPETNLDIFKPDPQFAENEKRYEELVKNILGDESVKDDTSSDEGSDDEEDEDSEEEEEEQMKIKDETETNLVNLRRTIYLTIMSSVDFEEAGHKLLKIKLEPGQEMELCIMLLECCSQERTYLRYYGLLGQRFCMINKIHQENFEKCFVQQYSMIHRLETNKLRNVAKFFAHLLGTDALPWHVLSYIRLTEEDTTSSSRIFIKILFQELSEHLGIRLLNERLTDPSMQESFESIFPKDNPKNTRFSINFFTSIGLGGITENLREYLKNMPRLIMQQQIPVADSDASGSSSPSSSSAASSSSSSSSESESDREVRKKRRRR